MIARARHPVTHVIKACIHLLLSFIKSKTM